MIPKKMADKKVGILGLGISGNSVLKSLEAGGSKVFAYDDNNTSNHKRINPTEWPWKELDQIIVSPGISLKHPVVIKAKELNIQINNEIDIFAKSEPKAKVIGVTGTNGKSTTSALLGHIIRFHGHKVEVGGNIGDAATSLVDPGVKGYIILELSSFQLETCSQLKLDGAVILNITPDHIEWHGNLKNYYNAKIKISSFLKKDAPLLISSNDNLSIKASEELKKIKNVLRLNKNDEEKNNLFKNSIHHKENIIGSIKLLSFFGMPEKESLLAIESFKGLPHRMEIISKKDNILFINDSKATNAEAASKALGFFENIFWIAGGLGKSDGIKGVLGHIKNVKRCYLFGKSKYDFCSELSSKVNCSIFDTMEEALKSVFKDTQNTKKEITILFSPGASSFDQFENFEDRGNKFKELTFQIWGI
jgi:UDP-N-acetylmuramoylalanine--D-glutamate ligase